VEQIVVFKDERGRSVFHRRKLGPVGMLFTTLSAWIAGLFGRNTRVVIDTSKDMYDDQGKLRQKDV
jgi:hypothetical protein